MQIKAKARKCIDWVLVFLFLVMIPIMAGLGLVFWFDEYSSFANGM